MVKKAAPKKAAPKRPPKQQPSTAPPTANDTPLQSAKDQQRLLDIFSDAFSSALTSSQFPTLLQEIKQALFNRDFAAAFGREDYLEAYAARWSPTRALCYASVLLGIREYLDGILASSEGVGRADVEGVSDGLKELSVGDENSTKEPLGQEQDATASQNAKELSSSLQTTNKTIKMLAIGGCAAEHLAFASYLHATSLTGTLTLIDSAPWTQTVSQLTTKTTTPPPLSKYASATAKASNTALLHPNQLTPTFAQHDILTLTPEHLARLAGNTPVLVTLLFTLNELYTSGGIGRTTSLLKTLGKVLATGSLLLVVDSPGSYSEAALGKEKKMYPMQWLLDHTLLEMGTPGYSWEKLESEESVWFRLPEGLVYPIQLENMRYQLHLYRLGKEDPDSI